jgi:transposase, IS30 family
MSVSGAAPVPAVVREVFWQARQDGRAVTDAAVAAGVSDRAAWHWLAERGGVRPRRPVPVSGRFLCLAEREEIAAGAAAGAGVREIARRLGRAPSTISRELARNRSRGGYRAVGADRRAQARRARPRAAKLAVPGQLRDYVQEGLERKWSPEEICARLVRDHPAAPEMRVCPETIYQSIYIQGRGALRRDLAAALRTGRAVRRPQRRAGERRGQIPGKVMISDRPAEVEDRAVPGHWESQCCCQAAGASAGRGGSW